jgi:hypothetical protein
MDREEVNKPVLGGGALIPVCPPYKRVIMQLTSIKLVGKRGFHYKNQ